MSIYCSPTDASGNKSTILFEGMAAAGIFPITNSYSRRTVGVKTVTSWLAVRGVATVALGVRFDTGDEQVFDHCFRFARFYELYHKPCVNVSFPKNKNNN